MNYTVAVWKRILLTIVTLCFVCLCKIAGRMNNISFCFRSEDEIPTAVLLCVLCLYIGLHDYDLSEPVLDGRASVVLGRQ